MLKGAENVRFCAERLISQEFKNGRSCNVNPVNQTNVCDWMWKSNKWMCMGINDGDEGWWIAADDKTLLIPLMILLIKDLLSSLNVILFQVQQFIRTLLNTISCTQSIAFLLFFIIRNSKREERVEKEKKERKERNNKKEVHLINVDSSILSFFHPFVTNCWWPEQGKIYLCSFLSKTEDRYTLWGDFLFYLFAPARSLKTIWLGTSLDLTEHNLSILT